MDRTVRIGLAGIDDRRLETELRALPIRPQVDRHLDLYEGIGPIAAQPPDLLFVGIDDGNRTAGDLRGALRLLHSLLPQLAVVLVVPANREIATRELGQHENVRVLVTPFVTGELASVVDHALAAADRPRDEVFLDLARGFADEVNNPLLFLMGHLQLLQLQCEQKQELLDQIGSALAGANRIQGTVERLRLLAEAAAGPRAHAAFDLDAELAAALMHPGDRQKLVVLREPEPAEFTVPGDARLLRPAVQMLVATAQELHAVGCLAHFTLSRLQDCVRLRLSLQGQGLPDWRLPRTFEPYYLNRLARGSSQGLSLFYVQTAVHAHRGLASARRLPDASLAIDLHLRAP